MVDVIVGNIFIIIALLVGLLSIFQREQKNDNRRERPVFGDQRPQVPNREQREQAKETVQEKSQEKMDEISEKASSWYEAMQDSKDRLEEVANENQDSIQSEAIGGMDMIKSGSIAEDDRSSISRVSVHQNITRKRIVESVIMAEVLGKPKSKKQRTI
ncbi:hypothetical protein [Alkalibacillus haloalkaliphilus]|uniref:hypothetical protein n=1 Tax=Alkalibacillus haloalkaliphilus TaxID=94136 RepID=UPI002936396E|nr:hypothetical protein [Alkalibacillus haloalkaliphilus]MDV2581026.1 hypothetical protein [Alkalibacillus haloalkaliphilus]